MHARYRRAQRDPFSHVLSLVSMASSTEIERKRSHFPAKELISRARVTTTTSLFTNTHTFVPPYYHGHSATPGAVSGNTIIGKDMVMSDCDRRCPTRNMVLNSYPDTYV